MKVLGTRWHHTARVDPKAETAQLKSRLVVQGVKTIPFLSSFGPTFTPLPRWDVATGGDTVFIKQPPGFEVPGREDHEYQLKRAAYGLPQSGRAFHLKVKDKLDQLDFVSLSEGVTLYIGRRGGDYVILVIYVDDGLIAGKKALVEDVVGELQEDFDVTFGGTVDGKSFLGRDISHDPQTGSILVSVKSQIEKALKMHGFENIKPLHMPIQPGVVYVEWDGEAIKPSEYLSAVGSLLFIATTASMSIHPRTLDYGLEYTPDSSPLRGFEAYSDQTGGACPTTSRSTMGYVFLLANGAVSWSSKLQPRVTASLTEAEYLGLSHACKETVYLTQLLGELGFPAEGAAVLYGDNQGANALSKDPQFHNRTRHLRLTEHFVREQVQDGSICVEYIPTARMLADAMT
ncbi:copia-type polyprotein, partial [Rhodotorula toruloides]